MANHVRTALSRERALGTGVWTSRSTPPRRPAIVRGSVSDTRPRRRACGLSSQARSPHSVGPGFASPTPTVTRRPMSASFMKPALLVAPRALMVWRQTRSGGSIRTNCTANLGTIAAATLDEMGWLRAPQSEAADQAWQGPWTTRPTPRLATFRDVGQAPRLAVARYAPDGSRPPPRCPVEVGRALSGTTQSLGRCTAGTP